MDTDTTGVLLSLAKEHPYLVLLITALPGITGFVQAVNEVIQQLRGFWRDWSQRKQAPPPMPPPQEPDDDAH